MEARFFVPLLLLMLGLSTKPGTKAFLCETASSSRYPAAESCAFSNQGQTLGEEKELFHVIHSFLFFLPLVAPVFLRLVVAVIVPFLMQSLIISLYLRAM